MENPELRERLLELRRRDEAKRDRLAADGSLFDGYHPEMEAVHRENAEELRAIIREIGWPGRTAVGEDGAEAAWLIAQHSIGEPDLMRDAFRLVETAVDNGDAPAWQMAYLDDRIRAFEGQQQKYGTQFDWDEAGRLVPWPSIEEVESVDARRTEVGLPPLRDIMERFTAEASKQILPADLKARRQEAEAWARRTGWRD